MMRIRVREILIIGIDSDKSPSTETEYKFTEKILTKKKSELSCTDQQSVFTFNREVTTSSVDLESFTNDVKRKFLTNKLKLTNISGNLFKDEEIVINNYGLQFKSKPKQIYHCFFGDNKSTKCDYEMNFDSLKENNFLFEIFYQKNLKKYILKTKTQISVLIDKPFLLERNVKYYFLFGDTVVLICLDSSTGEVEVKLDLKSGEELGRFRKNSLPLTVGRTKTNIKIDKPGISKRHAMIEYRETDDSYFLRDLNSTNGTQLLLIPNEKFMIGQQNNFKLGDNVFNISEFFSY